VDDPENVDERRDEIIPDTAEEPRDEMVFEPEPPTEVLMVEMALPPPYDADSRETEMAASGAIDPPEPVEETGPDRLAELAELVRSLDERMARRMDGLAAAFEREARAEATREKIVDRLHDELQQYKGDLLLGTLRPVLLDLIQLHDDIGKVAVPDRRQDQDTQVIPEVGRLLGLMRGFQQGIEDILYRQGVEPFEVEGELFDPRRQRAVATVATDDPSLARTVAGRLRKGFAAGEKVIRPELVTVRKCASIPPPGQPG
jgi:molecular chaperone GrpE